MGCYLIIMLLGFDKHRTEAFSSLAIADFKCFLRLHIDKAGTLRVYPIGIDKTPKSDHAALKPRLLEPGPIIITPSV